MWKSFLLGAWMALGLASSSAVAVTKAQHVVPPAGYRLELSFTSAVPDLYYVMSGPAKSYARFRINEMLRKALEKLRKGEKVS